VKQKYFKIDDAPLYDTYHAPIHPDTYREGIQ